MSDNRRIIRGSRFLVTKMFPGGKKYFIEPIKKVIGSILLASETIGTKISDSYWLYYKGLYGDGEYMSFIVDTTLNPDNPNDNTITVPFTLYTPRYSFTIDWGDSTSTDIPANTELLSTILSHTYDTGGKYTITIISKDKKIPVLNWNNFSNTNKNKNKLIQLSTPLIQFDPACPNSNSLAYFANGCVNLSSIPKKLFYYNGGVTNYDYCFNGCSKLDHIPSDILKYVKYQSSFQNFISNNPSLIYVPEDLFSTSKALDLSNALSGDFNLKMNIDVNKFFGSGDYINTDVHGIFKDCVNTTGNATDFTTKFTKSVAYVEGTGEFDTGYGTLTGKIYSQVLYNEHGDIVRDLIPAKTGNSYNGKLAPQDCLYDSVGDEFLLPTSQFVYGVENDTDGILENNLPNSFKKEALYNCEKWDNFAIPETVWTANPSTRDTWLSTSDRYQDWLVADDKNTLLLNKETFDLTYNSNDSIEATPYHTMSYLLGGRYEVTPDGTIKPDQFSTVDNLINIIKALPDLGSGSQVNVDISHCVNKSELPDEYRQMVQDKGYTLIY